jgi:integrative and conjugative element protein (TIGR02256 family)
VAAVPLVRRMRSLPDVIVYPIGTTGQQIILANSVVAHLRRHRQRWWYQKEAGGQLFARLEGDRIQVVDATGPRRTDRRTRTGYHPDRRAEQDEIAERHPKGLHFVGDWHTHPDTKPQPSGRDLASMAECFAKSAHGLNGFLLLIVGTVDLPCGIHASLHDGKAYYVLTAVEVQPISE